ncbi:MAG: YbbR-like domain-containing protein [Candidatus Krumholzibacteriia bacterium]
MQLISGTRGLLDNLGVKLIALMVALVIWFNASGQQQVNKHYVASLSFANVPDSLTLVGDVPDQVELSISGTRRELLLIGFRKIAMVVNMARAAEGRFTHHLSVSDILLPPGIEPGDIRIIAPAVINLGVERIVTERIRVGVIFENELSSHLMHNRLPETRPAWVKVTGPASSIRRLQKQQRIPTRPVDLSRIKESVNREVEVEHDRTTLEVVPDRVVVSISVSARAERVLANVPPTILLDEKIQTTDVVPKTVSLTIEGPQAVLDTLSSGDVSVLVNLSGKPPGWYTMAPEIIVPEGVQGYKMDVDSLRIRIN